MNQERYEFIENMVEKVKSVPVEKIVGRRINLQWKGRHLMGLCPFHRDTKIGSFVVTPDKGMWKCFTCGQDYAGHGIKFAMLFDNKDFLESCFQIAMDESIISYDEYERYSKKATSTEVKKMERKCFSYEKKKKNPIAEPDVLHEVYENFKSLCTLSDKHREHLEKVRQLSAERIERDYFSFPVTHKYKLVSKLKELGNYDDDLLLKVPGFFWDIKSSKIDFMSVKGIGILIRNMYGKVVGIQIRKDTIKPGESRYIWFSSTFAASKPELYKGGVGCGSPRDIIIPENPKHILCLTEGRFKGEKIAEKGSIAMSVQGITTWKGIVDEIKVLHEAYNIRKIYFMFDADMLGNTGVFDNIIAMYNAIKMEIGDISIFYNIWRIEHGKGIDDVIVNNNLSKVVEYDISKLCHIQSMAIDLVLKSMQVKDLRDLSNMPAEAKKQFETDLQATMQGFLNLPK